MEDKVTEVHRTKTGKPLGPGLIGQFAREADQSYHPHAAHLLSERAASYATDAETFRREQPLDGPGNDYWATLYTIVAQELRNAARHAGGQEPTEPLTRPGDRPVATLGPDAQLVLDESLCIVICTPERRITVGDVARWREGLTQGKTFQTIYADQAEEDRRAGQADRLVTEGQRRMRERETGRAE